MRRLLIVPIIHSQSDLGSLATSVHDAKSLALGTARTQAITGTVDQFWNELTRAVQCMNIDYDQLLVYQDGLPVIENSALRLERQIVEDLAKAGSPNHKLVLWLIERGACLVGTESAQLLMQEYHAIKRRLARGYLESVKEAQSEAEDKAVTTDSTDGSSTEGPSLLQQRDQFIAHRIASTLGNSQLGMLLIGMLHRVESYLPDDISCEYPIGRPRNI